MSAEQKDEEAIFKSVIKLKTSVEREAYLKEACGDDAKLLLRLEILLKAHEQADDFLDSSPFDANVTLDNSPISEGPGTVIGRYKLLEKIGEGGFGVVYMADQTKPISRRVAFKIIKLGMDTKEVIARFEAERQALAMMEHPNIAKVLDAGATDTGRPYFVMELVKGIPITEYCDSNNLDTRQRLELFISVCKAIQHAHQKGIIHRDLKPSNVMITLHDGKPVPKVIDFGIAKATGQRLTEKTLFTRFAQMIGTPEYMSPEQAEFSGLDVDTRTDIYSLGVILYQLLTGVTPFDGEKLREAGYSEMQRIIREEDPDKPSTKLSTMGKALTDVARHRRVAPEALRKLIRGDLDWIVMKTLEKDRTRRYESSHELATDIERHLADELVLAGPPGTGYRLRKFVRRNRVAVITGLLIAVALLAVAVISAMYAREATLHARDVAIHADKVEIARQNAVDAQQETAGLLAGSYVDRPQALCEQGEVGRGMLWLADSLKIAPDGSSDLDRAVRTSLAAWYGQLHSLRAVVQYPLVALGFTEGPAGTYTMTGSGTAFGGTADQFHFAYRTLTGPGSIVVRVDRLEWTSASVKAGVMIRETLDAGSKYALTSVAPFGAVGFLRRVDPDARSIGTRLADDTVPHWVKLERDAAGNFTASHSANGTTWEPAEDSLAVNIPMNANVYIGLAVTSGYATDVCEAVFSNVRTTGSVSAEWVHQDIGTQPNAAETLYPNQINAVTFSPDGSRILAACLDGTVRFCNSTTGQPIGRPLHHGSAVRSVTISPDGTRIATRGAGGSVQLWDAVTLRSVGEPIQDVRARSATFSPDSSRLVTGGTDGVIRRWDANSGQSLGNIFQYKGEGNRSVQALAFCPEGLRVVLKIGQGMYQMFDADRGEPIGPVVYDTQPTTTAAISPDGMRFALAGGLIRVWDAATGKLELEPIVHGGTKYALAFSPDGSRITGGGDTRMAVLWDVTTGKSIVEPRRQRDTAAGKSIGPPLRQRDTVYAAAFSPDGTRLVTGNQGGVLRIWDLIQCKNVGEPVKHEDQVLAAAYGPDGLRILTETDGALQVRDAATGKPIGRPFTHPDRISRIRFSPDGSRLVTRGRWGRSRLWDVATGQPIGKRFGGTGAIFSPDGTRILMGGGPAAQLWDAATLERIGEFQQHRDLVFAVAFSPDGSQCVTGSFDGTTQLWDAATLKPIGKPLLHQSEVKAVAFSPDGKKILIGFADGTVRLWDVTTLRPIGTPLQYLQIVCSVAFSPDGSQLLACAIDRTARIWDTTTVKPIGPPLEHGCWWPRASFSPDGSEILLAGNRATTEVWQAPPAPLEGGYERIVCWVQVVTGMELDPTGGSMCWTPPHGSSAAVTCRSLAVRQDQFCRASDARLKGGD